MYCLVEAQVSKKWSGRMRVQRYHGGVFAACLGARPASTLVPSWVGSRLGGRLGGRLGRPSPAGSAGGRPDRRPGRPGPAIWPARPARPGRHVCITRPAGPARLFRPSPASPGKAWPARPKIENEFGPRHCLITRLMISSHMIIYDHI